jgi:hypothetical protein
LLPGYIAVILTIVLIFPELTPVQKENGLSLDFFSAIIFIVAGPAVGYTLRQLHRIFYNILGALKKSKRKQAIEQYYELRIAMNDSEKAELDMSEGQYDFDISTGIILLVTASYFAIIKNPLPEWTSILMMGMSIILFIGGYLERKDGYIPLYTQLLMKYKLDIKGKTKMENKND